MDNLKLFMLMIGCKPEGKFTEQHDTMFSIAPDFLGTEQDARAHCPECEKIHIDAFRKVTMVEGYRISIVPKRETLPGQYKLFFINLGGYIAEVFDEFHDKMLIVAKDISEAQKIAKKSAFCLQHPGPSKDSLPHIDDKYGIDIDDTYDVEEILPERNRDKYSILIEDVLFKEHLPKDYISVGYQRYEKMKK